MKKSKPTALISVNIRLFADDLAEIKQIAASRRTPYQVEIRQIIHRSLKGERREVLMLKEGKPNE